MHRAPLAAYAGLGGIVTDDNQLLQWSPLRPRESDAEATKLNNHNVRLLQRYAGRPPFTRPLRGTRPRPLPAPR